MISCSHWGLFSDFRPFMIPKGFKLSKFDLDELRKPGGIIEIIPLAKGEPQPVYSHWDDYHQAFVVAPDGDCA